MEFTSLVDTSLDLNCRPLRLLDDVPKQEVQSNFIGLGRDIPSVKDEAGDLLEELNRVSAENKKLTEMLTVMCQNYNALRNQLMEHLSKQNSSGAAATDDHSAGSSRKRKAESSSTPNNNDMLKSVHQGQQQSESSSSDEDSSLKKPREEHIKTNTTRVYVRTEASDTTLIVKDGYQWRKYGQKVTRDNPSPRAYFKCSFAPSCPVKKKVQRSVEDQSVLVATYEGEHNHPHPCSKTDTNGAVTTSPTSRFHVKSTTTTASAPCSATQSLTESKTVVENKKVNSSTNDKKKLSSSSAAAAGGSENKPEFQQFLIEQMASTLTKDPSFQAALAAAISGKILLQNNDK